MQDRGVGFRDQWLWMFIVHFEEIIRLLEHSNRQYGVSNLSYTHYILERLETCLQTCRSLRQQITPANITEKLLWYRDAFDEVVSNLQTLIMKWEEYWDIVGSRPLTGAAYAVPVQHTGRQGCPRFDVTKEQLEYLRSLSFTWTDVSALLGVSRATIII